MSIIVNSLSYTHPDRVPLFSGIGFSVPKGGKAALVGDNGTGKSTLLRIIAGELSQSEGSLSLSGKPYYVPQHAGRYDGRTIAEALGVDRKINAMHAIIGGNASSGNFALLDDDWAVEERVEAAFAFWGIGHLRPELPVEHLSGGERTKVFLAGMQVLAPDIILLDEPTNHLDSRSREILHDFIRQSPQTVLCVSHDRTLLNLFEMTLELSNDAAAVFGGNYEFYRHEKDIQLQALQKQLEEKEKSIRQAVQKSREIAVKRQKQESRGKAGLHKKGLPRIVANSLQGKAENSSAKIRNAQEEKLRELSESAGGIKARIQRRSGLRLDIRTSGLHRGKVLADARDINFSYGGRELWKEPLTVDILSGERVCIEGANGTGKTTLAGLLTGELTPCTGDVFIAGFQSLYIDQDYSIINDSLTLIEQVERFNDRNMQEHDLRMMLHTHHFPRETWDKECGCLSGGEKMKLILCCAAVRDNTPDMIVLDEPTNNLDIRSQRILTDTVKNFHGTVIVISHDEYFKNEIGIDKYINLDGISASHTTAVQKTAES